MNEERKGRLQDEVEKLEQMRDELRLQAHLFKADMKDEWDDLQKKFDSLKQEANPVKRAAGETVDEIGEAAGMVIDTVFDGFKRMRDSLK